VVPKKPRALKELHFYVQTVEVGSDLDVRQVLLGGWNRIGVIIVADRVSISAAPSACTVGEDDRLHHLLTVDRVGWNYRQQVIGKIMATPSGKPSLFRFGNVRNHGCEGSERRMK
jgi:hypothetical protein